MALSVSNVCLHRTNLNLGFQCVKRKVLNLSFNKNHARNLRGTRLSGTSKEETKYRNLIKLLKKQSNEPIVYNSGNIPVGEVTSSSAEITSPSDTLPSDSTKEAELFLTSAGYLFQKLEEKITPLEGFHYNRQLERKYLKSLALLRAFGQKLRASKVPIGLGEDNLPCPVELTIPSPVVEAYRNQDEFSIGMGVDENPKTVGYFAGTYMDNMLCMSALEVNIIKESHKEFVKDFQNFIQLSPLKACVKRDDGGYWHSLRIRSNLVNELMGVIVMHPQNLTKEELHEEGEKLRKYFSAADKPYNLQTLYFQTSIDSRCDGDMNLQCLFGSRHIEEKLNDLKFQISPNSYFPSNTEAAEVAYKNLLKICKVKKSTTILDIFCGIGPLSIMLAPHVHSCIGIDSCYSSIKYAKQNALLNNVHNVQFYESNIDYLISEILNKDYYEDLMVIINPARTELSKKAIKILRSCKHLKKIVYISTKHKIAADHFDGLCKPPGSEHYLGKYFVPILAVPYDLYPQTKNFGLIVMFQRL